LLTPEQNEVVAQVVTKMAGPPTSWRASRSRSRRGTHWWLDHEELLSEAIIACMTTDVLTGATSLGAFHVRLHHKLIDAQKTEREWREERSAPFEEDDDCVAAARSTAPHDRRDDYVPGERSELLDTRASMTNDEFVAWADQELGRAYAKKRDVRTLLYGSSTEQTQLWAKYSKGKRVSGGKRLMIDGAEATEGDYQETLSEDWKSRYRWTSDGSHPLVMSVDGQTVEVARMLRQPVR